MKKILALILALAMVCALAACGRSDVSGNVTPVEKASDDAPKGTVSPAEAPAETEAAEAPAETEAVQAAEEGSGDAVGEIGEEAQPAEAEEEGSGDAIGGIDDEGTGEAVGEIAEEEQPSEVTQEAAGMRYENENIGVGVLLDEDWVIYNDEQLAQLSGLTADMFSDEKYKEMMEKSNSFTDFFAQHSSGASMNVMFENLGLLYGSVLSEEQYRTAAMQNMAGAYESAGFENVQIEENTVEFAGAERVGIHTSCTVNGVNYYVQQVLIKAGSHMGIISLCCFVQDDTPLMASFFYPLG